MTIDELKKFSSTDPKRRQLCRPWSHGEHSFASDGRIIVRIPKPVENAPAEPDITGGARNAPLLFMGVDFETNPLALPALPELKFTDCDYCGGLEKPCDECESTRKLPLDQPLRVRFNHFNTHLLARIASLPGLRIYPETSRKCSDPLAFTFDGGDGLLMPMALQDWNRERAGILL